MRLGAVSGETEQVNEQSRTQTILVVDDEPMVREVLGNYLRHDGFDVIEVDDGAQAIETVDTTRVSLVLLDLMLPERPGLDVLAHIRSTSSTPVILLTALGDEHDRIAGLEGGADDYVVKPFSPREVVARVRSVLRRTGVLAVGEVQFGEIVIDLDARTVQRGTARVDLPRLEFDLLVYLASRPGQVLTREDVLRDVWQSSGKWQDPATVTVHIRRLRAKLEEDPSNPKHLLTAYGVGYRFEP